MGCRSVRGTSLKCGNTWRFPPRNPISTSAHLQPAEDDEDGDDVDADYDDNRNDAFN